MTTTDTTTRQAPKAEFKIVPLSQVHESPFNPRKTFDPGKMANITQSLRIHGQLEPGLARPRTGGGYELAAGHRRKRGAQAAGIPEYALLVRPMTDVELIEILTIDNDEREDVHPLEQAEGYKLLITKGGYNVERIAERIGRSHEFINDRLRLLELIPALQAHFLEGHFTIGHAMELAKLSDAEQTKLNKEPTWGYGGRSGGGLWQRSDLVLGEDKGIFKLVARTVAELKHHIAHEMRFDEEALVLEEIFPETADMLELAQQTDTRVVSISHSEHLRYAAKSTAGERTFTKHFWKRADGEGGSKVCDYAVVGVVRAGEGRGQSMGVCLRRDKCLVHWKSQALAHAKRAAAAAKKPKKKAPTSGSSASTSLIVPKAKPQTALEKAKSAHAKLVLARGDKVEAIYQNNLRVAVLASIASGAPSAFGASGAIGKAVVVGLARHDFDSYQLDVKRSPKSGDAVEVVRWLAQEFLVPANPRTGGDVDEEIAKGLVDLVALKKAAEAAVDPVPVFVAPPAAPKKKGAK